jgi:hypothetical protein
MVKSQRDALRDSAPFHAVRFYEDSRSLGRIVAGFITEGLATDDPAIIIATPEHRHSILEAAAESIDIERLTRRGDLIVLDADEALSTFIVDGMPAAKPFEQAVVPLIDKAAGGRKGRVVRVYGEMADVLWKHGREAAAIRLEMLGNQLMSARQVSILCGYSMDNFYMDAAFARICCEHTHVVSADGVAAVIGPAGVI